MMRILGGFMTCADFRDARVTLSPPLGMAFDPRANIGAGVLVEK
jgi:hypothetical protein